MSPTNDDETDRAAEPATNDGKIADFQVALARLDNNPVLLEDMIGFFRQDVPQLLEDIQAAIAAGDAAQAKRAAHSIKGLASSFDAEQLQNHALHVETMAANGQLSEVESELPKLRACTDNLLKAFDEFEQRT